MNIQILLGFFWIQIRIWLIFSDSGKCFCSIGFFKKFGFRFTTLHTKGNLLCFVELNKQLYCYVLTKSGHVFLSVLWIRIQKDPNLFAGSGSEAERIRIQILWSNCGHIVSLFFIAPIPKFIEGFLQTINHWFGRNSLKGPIHLSRAGNMGAVQDRW